MLMSVEEKDRMKGAKKNVQIIEENSKRDRASEGEKRAKK